jgi:hypothetical protein
LLLLALASAGCGQLLGVNDYVVDQSDGGAPDGHVGVQPDAGDSPGPAEQFGPFRYTDHDCGRCVEQSCAPEAEACNGELACAAFAQCLALCDADDPACRGRCAGIAGAYDAPQTVALQQCEARYCEACNGQKVTFEACDTCLVTQCPDAVEAAAVGGDPAALEACTTGVGDCRSVCNRADMSCLGYVDWPQPDTNQLSFTVGLVERSTGYPVAGRPVEACVEGGQLRCGAVTPGAVTTPNLLGALFEFSDRDPIYEDRFFGHLWMEDTDGLFFNQLLYFFPHPRRSGAARGILWKRTDTLNMYASNIPGGFDPTRGLVAFETRSCNDKAAPGVSFEVIDSAGHQVLYGFPPVATRTSTDATFGIVFIANLEPGFHTIEGTYTDSETPGAEPVRYGTVTVLVEADSLTSFNFVPTPD